MSQPASPHVTVAIVNFNGRRFLETLLRSLDRQTVRGFAIHIVDDASTDDARAYVQREWPHVRWLGGEANRGITATMARAVDTAATEYVAILNNDLELDPHWLEELLEAIARPSGRRRCRGQDARLRPARTGLDGAGDRLGRDGYPGRRGQGEPDDGRFDRVEEIFGLGHRGALPPRRLRRRGTRTTPTCRRTTRTSTGASVPDSAAGRRGTCPTAVAYHMGSATTAALRVASPR